MTIKDKLNKTNVFLGILVSVIILGGAGFGLDQRWAQGSNVLQLQKAVLALNYQVSQQILQSRINSIQERMWKLQDRHNTEDCMQMPGNDRDEYRKLQKENALLQLQLQEIMKKTVK